MTKIVSITEFRKNLFELMEAVQKGAKIVIKKDDKKIAVVGEYKEEFDWEKYEKEAKKAVEYLRQFDWSDVEEVRKKSKIRRYKGW